MSDWYDRDGKPLVTVGMFEDEELWGKQMDKVEKLLKDRNYKVIKQDYTPGKKYWVSTVWLGLDQSFGLGGDEYKPIIFETMVFSGKTYKRRATKGLPSYSYRKDYEQLRYSTEAEALKGHEKLLKEYTDKEGY